MPHSKGFAIGLVAIMCTGVFGDEVREYKKDGKIYRETRRKVLRPVTETQVEERERTVYREELNTEMCENERTVLSPVTEYRWEAYWAGRWNPFAQPYLAYRLVPRTRLEAHTEIVRKPVTTRRLVPETRVVQVPVTTHRMVEEEHVHQVVVNDTSAGDPFDNSTAVARRTGIGGSKLSNDPPREGADTAWRPSRSAIRR